LAKLVIYEELDGEETIFEDFELSIQRILIGSSEDNNLVLDIPDIDPSHASLELRNDRWVIQDLGGPGGTVVNGEQVDGPRPLRDNDLIELHTLRIRFLEDNQSVEDTPEETIELALDEIHPEPKKEMSGSLWFGTVAGITLIVIFVIVFILIILAYLGIINLSDLLPLA